MNAPLVQDTILLRKNRYLWNILAFQGGFVNVAGLLTVHVFVSHITGFAAHFGVAFFESSFMEAIYFLLVPVFFLLGSFFSSILTELRRAAHKEPIYIFNMGTLAFMYLMVSVLGYARVLGDFGEPFESFRDFILLSVLAFSCGLQNALFTHYAGSVIRTTHLTGLTTDLGIGLAKSWFGHDHRESRLNRLRLELILFFMLGSFVGAWLFPKLEFLGFLIPVVLTVFVGMRLFSTRSKALSLS